MTVAAIDIGRTPVRASARRSQIARISNHGFAERAKSFATRVLRKTRVVPELLPASP